MNKVICVVGPTAVGKSSLAIDLARKYQGEIINGDSIAIYRQLNIGSAKPTKQEQELAVHHLIDIRNVGEDYNVAQFQQDGRECIQQLQKRGKLPIVCGGTGLYIKALLYDYQFLKEEQQEDDQEYAQYDNQQLYQMLREVDPLSCEKIHINNRKRVIRALQIAKGGTTKSAIDADQQHEMIYDAMLIGLTIDRASLHDRISQRVDIMLKEGLLDEVKDLFSCYPAEAKGLDGIGYKEFVPYLKGEITLEEAIENVKTHTRQFAKRQYTWWNHQLPVTWYDITEENYRQKIYQNVEHFLNVE